MLNVKMYIENQIKVLSETSVMGIDEEVNCKEIIQAKIEALNGIMEFMAEEERRLMEDSQTEVNNVLEDWEYEMRKAYAESGRYVEGVSQNREAEYNGSMSSMLSDHLDGNTVAI